MHATVTFSQLVQDSQDYGSDDEHMVSRVFFSIQVGDKTTPDLYADIKQTVGSSFDTGPLEVSRPHGYTGPFNYEAFQSAVEKYFRSVVGGSGSGISIQGARNIRMRNNRFQKSATATFPVETDNKAW